MRKAVSIFSRILLGILLLLTLAPFYLLVINSFKGQTEIIKTPFQLAVNWQFMNYAKALPQVVRPMLNSLLVTFAVILITVVVSMLASYAFRKRASLLWNHRFAYDTGLRHADTAVCTDNESGAVQFLLGADSAARRLSGGDGDVPDAKLHGGHFQKPV